MSNGELECAHRCFAASLIADANAAAPPNVSVKTGFSLSTIRLQIRFTGRTTIGRKINEPTNNIAKRNLKKAGNIGRACCANSSDVIGIYFCREMENANG